jgi:hypothetical protein
MAEFDATDKKSGLSPEFFLPPNVIDLRYTESDVADGEEEPVDMPPVDETPDFSDSDDLNPESSSLLPIPDSITVVSQTVRSPAGGGYVVDVVIDIPTIPGIENFDVQVAKA